MEIPRRKRLLIKAQLLSRMNGGMPVPVPANSQFIGQVVEWSCLSPFNVGVQFENAEGMPLADIGQGVNVTVTAENLEAAVYVRNLSVVSGKVRVAGSATRDGVTHGTTNYFELVPGADDVEPPTDPMDLEGFRILWGELSD